MVRLLGKVNSTWGWSTPEEIVDADDVAVAYAHGVFTPGSPERIAVEIVAGEHGLLEPIALLLDPLGVGVVDAVGDGGVPGQLVLQTVRPAVWIAFKDAAEDRFTRDIRTE